MNMKLKQLITVICFVLVPLTIYYFERFQLGFYVKEIFQDKTRFSQHIVKLDILAQGNLPENPLFFVETANHSFLGTRQSCTVESALRNSKMSPVILMTSDILNVSGSNATAQLIQNYGERLTFFKLDLDDLARNTPVESISGKLNNSSNKIEHLSDLVRLLVLHKFGGGYLDLDFIVLKELSEVRNSLFLTNMVRNMTEVLRNNESCDPNGPSEKGHVANGALFLEKGHPLLFRLLTRVAERYKSEMPRNGIGPPFLTSTVERMYETDKVRGLRVPDLTVMPTYSVFPVGCNRVMGSLWLNEDRSEEEMNTFLNCSLAVHFFSYLTRKKPIRRDPKREIYSYLAAKHCPLSFYSSDKF